MKLRLLLLLMVGCVCPCGGSGSVIWTDPSSSWKVVEEFCKVHFSYVTNECWVVHPDVDGFPGFSGKLFVVLIS